MCSVAVDSTSNLLQRKEIRGEIIISVATLEFSNNFLIIRICINTASEYLKFKI